MKINHLFSAPLWEIDLEFDHNIVSQKILEIKNQNPEKQRIASNVGGWQSIDFEGSFFNRFVEFHQMYSQLQKSLDKISKSIHYANELEFDKFWLNVSTRNNYNATHLHQSDLGICLSGVLYIKVDSQTGNLVFHDDFTPNKYYRHIQLFNGDDRNLFKQTYHYKPIVCRMIVFPAWLSHSVEKCNSDSERISIAFDIKTVQKRN